MPTFTYEIRIVDKDGWPIDGASVELLVQGQFKGEIQPGAYDNTPARFQNIEVPEGVTTILLRATAQGKKREQAISVLTHAYDFKFPDIVIPKDNENERVPARMWVPALVFASLSLLFIATAFFFTREFTKDQRVLMDYIFAFCTGMSLWFMGGSAMMRYHWEGTRAKIVFTAVAGAAMFALVYLRPLFSTHEQQVVSPAPVLEPKVQKGTGPTDKKAASKSNNGCIAVPKAWASWKGDKSFRDNVGSHDLFAKSVKFDAGKTLQGFVFDGISSEATAQDDPKLSGTSGFSVVLWIKADPNQQDKTGIVDLIDKGSGFEPHQNKGWGIVAFFKDDVAGEHDLKNKARFFVCPLNSPDDCKSSSVFSDAEVNIFDGKWHHLAGVYDGSTLSLHVDLKMSGPIQVHGSIVPNDRNLYLGRAWGGEGIQQAVAYRRFTGMLDDIAFYDQPLSQGQVETVYNRGLGKCK
jgi:hypothetical protein